VTNPAFQGTIPELDAIDMSTLRPGVGDSVGMTPRSSAEGYGGAESATVYGPDGQTLNVTRNDERFRWTPEQTGTHTIRLTYSNTIGGEFTETVRVGVEETPRRRRRQSASLMASVAIYSSLATASKAGRSA